MLFLIQLNKQYLADRAKVCQSVAIKITDQHKDIALIPFKEIVHFQDGDLENEITTIRALYFALVYSLISLTKFQDGVKLIFNVLYELTG